MAANFFVPSLDLPSRWDLCFRKGLDCILSILKLIKLSSYTNTRGIFVNILSVVEGVPYPNHIGLRYFTRGLPNP